MKETRVFNIQRFSTHDGDGVRTTIFFKGCPLKCKWCHNPESQQCPRELITYKNKCVNCGRCVTRCPEGCLEMVEGKLVFHREKCTVCGKCVDACFHEAREIAGKAYTVKELYKEAIKDQMFFEKSGGGITLSGGEVMSMNMDYIEQLCKMLHRDGISIFVDTSGFAPYERFQRLLPYVDVFMVDIKHMDPAKHREFIGVDNKLILENIVKLSHDGAGVYIRIPVVEGVNADDEFIQAIMDFLETNHVKTGQIALLPYHDIGKSKYANLDRAYDEESMQIPANDKIEHFKSMFEEHGFQNVKIGG